MISEIRREKKKENTIIKSTVEKILREIRWI